MMTVVTFQQTPKLFVAQIDGGSEVLGELLPCFGEGVTVRTLGSAVSQYDYRLDSMHVVHRDGVPLISLSYWITDHPTVDEDPVADEVLEELNDLLWRLSGDESSKHAEEFREFFERYHFSD